MKEKKLFTKALHFIGFLSLIGLFTACTNLAVHVPTPIVRDPQVPGKTSFYGKLGARHTKVITAITAADSRPPDMNQSIYGSYSSLYTDVGFGLGSQFNLGLDLSLLPAMAGLNFTWQFLGPSRAESTLSGAWVAAIYGSRMNSTASLSGDQQTRGGPGGYAWSATATATTTTGGISAGRFIADKALLFFGYSYSNLALTSRDSQKASTIGDSPAAEYSTSTNGWSSAPGIGIRYGREYSISGTMQFLTSQYFGLGIVSESTLNIVFSIHTRVNPTPESNPSNAEKITSLRGNSIK